MENTDLIHAIKDEFDLILPEKISYAELHTILSDFINDLIKNDFEKLVTHLYRIDINEADLKKLLQQDPPEDAGKIISKLIMERQQQKIISRSQFSRRKTNSDEEEKW